MEAIDKDKLDMDAQKAFVKLAASFSSAKNVSMKAIKDPLDSQDVLFRAAMFGNSNLVISIIEGIPAARIDLYRNSKGLPLLSVVATRTHLEVLEALLQHGLNPNEADEEGNSPLHLALRRISAKNCIFKLLEFGGDMMKKNKEGISPWHYAAEAGSLDILRVLATRPGSPESFYQIRDSQGRCPLHYAARLSRNDFEALLYLLELTGYMDPCDHDGLGVFHYLLQPIPIDLVDSEGQILIAVRSLLKHGYDPSKRTKDGTHPLKLALTFPHPDVVQLMISEKSCRQQNLSLIMSHTLREIATSRRPKKWKGILDLVEENETGIENIVEDAETVMHMLCRHAKPASVLAEQTMARFLAKGAKYDSKASDGKTPFQLLQDRLFIHHTHEKSEFLEDDLYSDCPSDHLDSMLLMLLKHDPDHFANRGESQECSPLDELIHTACSSGRQNLLQAILDEQTLAIFMQSWDKGNQLGMTPLIQATRAGHHELCQFLLDKGASVDTSDKHGSTPLMHAAINGDLRTLQTLLEYNADLTARCTNGSSALLKAASWGRYQVVQELLRRGCDINCQDTQQLSPLSAAAAGGHADTVALLLDEKADTRMTDTRGWNAAHHACASGSVEIMKLLEDHDLDWDAIANIEEPTNEISAPLLFFDVYYSGRCMEYLLKKGLIYQATWNSSQGLNPLQAACINGQLQLVKLLLEYGADVNATTPEKSETALHFAAMCGKDQLISLLLDNHAVIDVKDAHGLTPMLYAQRGGHQKVVELLQSAIRAQG